MPRTRRRKRPGNIDAKSKKDMTKRVDANDEEEEKTDEEEEEDEIRVTEDANAEMLQIDFEALPLAEEDITGLTKLIRQQLFLQSKIDITELCKQLIRQAPIGSLFSPADEFVTSDSEYDVYGVLTVVNIAGDEEWRQQLREHIVKCLDKNASQLIRKQFNEYLSTAIDSSINTTTDVKRRKVDKTSNTTTRIGLIVNERLLNLPPQIAPPAFQSLIDDLHKSTNPTFAFTHFLIIMKVHIADIVESGNAGKKLKQKSKRTDDEDKDDETIVYANEEEKQLLQMSLMHFDYPVQSEVEHNSLFGVYTSDAGHIYRPYRRVALIERDQFEQFVVELNEK